MPFVQISCSEAPCDCKAKYGIIERENYNKPKSDDARRPKCLKEKQEAIAEVLKFFR